METGETKWLGLGVVFGDYGTNDFPGWMQGTVGYHTDDRTIYDADYKGGDHNAKATALIGKICFVCYIYTGLNKQAGVLYQV